MAKSTFPQSYPRIQDESDKFHGFLDETSLMEHSSTIGANEIKAIIAKAIAQANAKSSRQILDIPAETSATELIKIYEKEGKKLGSAKYRVMKSIIFIENHS
ncbi:MAG: hypothetical protein KF734_12480 [Saprospiraceae bacterium]|nr:hypothetical protein [Saprospiraceae bacterium]